MGFSREKSQSLRENQPISQDFRGRKVKLRRIFRGKFSEKSADFTGNFAKKQSVKNSQFRWIFFWANLAKLDQFCVDMTSVF